MLSFFKCCQKKWSIVCMYSLTEFTFTGTSRHQNQLLRLGEILLHRITPLLSYRNLLVASSWAWNYSMLCGSKSGVVPFNFSPRYYSALIQHLQYWNWLTLDFLTFICDLAGIELHQFSDDWGYSTFVHNYNIIVSIWELQMDNTQPIYV